MPPGPSVATYLFTDIEGSTRLWEADASWMSAALAAHDKACRAAVAASNGRLVKMTGDGLLAVFEHAVDAVAAALAIQRGVASIGSKGDLRLNVRCGVHTGTSQYRDGDYFGTAVNRAARIMSAGNGGQVLLSQATVDSMPLPPDRGTAFCLGRVRLRDLSEPVPLWQFVHPDLQRDFPPLRSLDSTPNNLPLQTSTFIGRERELLELKEEIASARLVTITGPGGVGKTRLSLQVAADMLDLYEDGIWFVEFGAVTNAELVAHEVARSLRIQEKTGQEVLDSIAEHLASRSVMLVLDNAEHQIDACASIADALLRRCRSLTIVVTSRERLALPGERVYRVPSLELPDSEISPTPEHIARFAAVRLFVERAKQQTSTFELTAGNAPAIHSICTRLDGIPLAIELAAARISSLSVEDLNRRLGDRFAILKSGARTALPRQKTLGAMIDWSYGLLTRDEQRTLNRLSVFASISLDAAERIFATGTDATSDILDVLARLCDKSLLLTEQRAGKTRYRMLETIRQYADERLREAGEAGLWRRKQLEYLVDVLQSEYFRGLEQGVALELLATEHDNIRAALDWSCTDRDHVLSALRVAVKLWRFWITRGYVNEGRHYLEAALATDATCVVPPLLRTEALHALGESVRALGDADAALRYHTESLDTSRRIGDTRSVAASLNCLGLVAADADDLVSARRHFEESLAILRNIGETWGIAKCSSYLAVVTRREGRAEEAETLFTESLRMFEDTGDRQAAAWTLVGLASCALARGQPQIARDRCEQALDIARSLDDRLTVARAFEVLGEVAYAFELPDVTVRMLAKASRLRQDVGASSSMRAQTREERDQLLARALAMIGSSNYESAWQAGWTMPADQLVLAIRSLDRPEERRTAT